MFDVYGFGNALVDLQVTVDFETLERIGHPAGAMILIDDETRASVLASLDHGTMEASAGGSVANSIVGVAALGGRPAFTGCIHDDGHGRSYTESLASAGVKFAAEYGDRPSGTCIVLITPDAQRTMLTTLGCAGDISARGICTETLDHSKILYIEGYLWDGTAIDACREAIALARKHDTKVAFTASDPFCVDRHHDDFRELLNEHVDIFFANAAEARHLTGLESAVEAAEQMGRACGLAVVTDSGNGAYVGTKDDIFHVPALNVTPIDTTGAGDAFAGGFLHGITNGHSLREAAEAGVRLAGRVIMHYGARPTAEDCGA